jgi:phosphoglucosamine mutase
MMAVDENGIFLSGDEMLAIFARYECKENATVVVPVDTSMIVDDALPGSTVIHTKVGDVYVAEEMKKLKADFGGEPSGSWIFPRISYCPDGIYAAALLVDIVKEKKLSLLRDELPKYPTLRSTVVCDNSKKAKVMEAISSKLATMGDVSNIDGIRVDMEDGWVLVRPSGTEAKIRITAEARKNVEELHAKVEHIVQGCL